MANCSAMATVVSVEKGRITRAYINCPEKADDECKCSWVVVTETLGNLQYEHKYCSCDAETGGYSAAGNYPSPPAYCHLEMTVVWEVRKEYVLDKMIQVRIIDVQVFCVGKCVDGQKCPDKPKVDTSTKDGITEDIYTCPCG